VSFGRSQRAAAKVTSFNAENAEENAGETFRRRSVERLSYWPEAGWGALTRREKDMRRWFAVNNKCLPMAGSVVISLVLGLLTALTLASPGTLQAQGPALTTISEVRYSDEGWGVGYNGNLIGRYTSSSFTLTRYARAQTYFLRSYDNSTPPKYSRYSTALHVDYPTS